MITYTAAALNLPQKIGPRIREGERTDRSSIDFCLQWVLQYQVGLLHSLTPKVYFTSSSFKVQNKQIQPL